MRSITTETDRQIRMRELAIQEEEDEKEREEARKNKGFTQIYPLGWKRIIELSKGNPGAMGLYAFLAENIDPTCGAVVASQQFLADRFEVSIRTIQNWLKYLEEAQALVRIPVAGRVCAYALNPYEVWKGYDTTKSYAAFVTKTLVNFDGDIRRRLMNMFDVPSRAEPSNGPNPDDFLPNDEKFRIWWEREGKAQQEAHEDELQQQYEAWLDQHQDQKED